MRIHFILIGEGTSDEGLIPHLESLCIDLGADEVTGTSVDFRRLGDATSRTVAGKVRAAMQLEPEANLLFIHRDADRPEGAHRYAEIAAGVETAALEQEWVAVVPIQETEAWLLTDEAAIRHVAGRPKGRQDLRLPPVKHLETTASPKERLQEALVTAAELTGRRLARFRSDFPTHRRLLLSRLPINGALLQVPAWVRLRADCEQALTRLREAPP